VALEPIDAAPEIEIEPDSVMIPEVVMDAAPPAPPKPPTPPKTDEPPTENLYENYVTEARKLFRARQHDQALEFIDMALAEKKTVRARTLKADILLDKGDMEAALQEINLAVRGSRSASAWLIKGQIHYAREEYGDAKTAFETYLKISPSGRSAEEVRLLLDTMQ